MNIALVSGSSGLIGGESVDFLASKFDKVVGIDNNLRSYFFGQGASTNWNRDRLIQTHDNFSTVDVDVRSYEKLEELFKKYSND